MGTIILKVTEDCNSNCIYCDVGLKKKLRYTMKLETLEIVFKRINQFLEKNIEEEILIIWHGGEPLLVGAGFFHAAFEFQEKHCRNTKMRVKHCIQTNLTLLNKEKISALKKLKIYQIGTSYDPEPHIRGPGTEINSGKYNKMFMKGICLLDRYNIAWGLIYVVTKKSLSNPMKIFNFLTNLNLNGSINLNPVLIYDEERQWISITPSEHTDFLGSIFPTWWRFRNRYPNVEPFRSLTSCIIDQKVSLSCAESGGCAYKHTNIAPNGETSQCGRSADWEILSYGNIKNKSLGEIFIDGQRDRLANRNLILPETECQGCRFWKICHGGCPLDAFNKHGDFDHKSEWCESKKVFIEEYFEPITGVRFVPEKIRYS